VSLSKAAQREREAVQLLDQVHELVFRAGSMLRADSTATILSGQLQAASLILDSVRDTIDRRTEEPA